jgi:DNA repair exonuclease SbcCD ATPase subunit
VDVSKEEAEKRIKKLLEKFPPSDKTPSPNNIFPEPIGEVSRKIQDINQALLTTAYTTRLLKTPPDEIMELRERIDSIIADIKSGLETKINELTKILDEKTKKEQREELLNELNSRIDPIRQNLEVLMKKLEMLEKGGKEESSIMS